MRRRASAAPRPILLVHRNEVVEYDGTPPLRRRTDLPSRNWVVVVPKGPQPRRLRLPRR